MLIGIDASRANRDHKSGTEWYSYHLIRQLAGIDDKNQYILYTDKPLKGGLLDLTCDDTALASASCGGEGQGEIVAEIKINKNGWQEIQSPHNNFKAKVFKWPFNFFWTQGRLSAEMLFNRPDVLFIPAHTLPVIYPAKSVITIHDVGFERDSRLYQQEQMGPADKKGRKILNFFVRLFTRGEYSAASLDYLRWSTKFALKRARKVITVSRFSKKEIMEIYGADGDKIKVIHNGYDDKRYAKAGDEKKIDEVLEKYGIKRPYILYIGRLERKKNTPALVEAFAIMRAKNKNIRHKLVLFGDAGFGFDEVKYTIREFDLVEEVIKPGWAEEEDKPYIYSGASAFIFPSLYEGFGIPLLEAMACETPIAASRAASIPEVAGDAALFFDQNDAHAIAEAMEKIIENDDLRKELAARGKERVKNFSWAKCARETLEEIEKL